MERESRTLIEIADIIISSVDKKTKHDERAIRLCNYTDIYKNDFIRSNMNFMTATATDHEIAKCTLLKGDVVITKDSEKYDDIGVPAFIKEDIDNLLCGYHLVILRPSNGKVDGAYLFYALNTQESKHQFHANANGITRFGLRKADIEKTTIPVPPLPEQRAIAHILGTLDDKIELNRRMNETLEAMARAIFTSWFVDFDPVRAKAEGRPTGLPEEIDALFPDSFEGSELGEIPKGWKVGAIGDIGSQSRNGVKPEEIEPTEHYIALEHMPKGTISLWNWENSKKITSGKFRFKKNDILFGKLRPYFHKVGVAAIDGICSTDIVVVIPRKEQCYGILLGHLSSDAFIAYTNASSTGTKMPRTSWKDMSRYPITIPDHLFSLYFTELITNIVQKLHSNIYESKSLTALRDTLLPKLISGELRIPDVERFIEEAGG